MSAPREGRWLAKPLRPRVHPVMIVAGLQQVWVALLCGSLLVPWVKALQPGLGIAILFLMFASLAGFPLRERALMRRTRRDRRLSDDPKVTEEIPVEIVIRAAGRRIGADRGILWFERNLIGFSGERSSFLVAATDLDYSDESVASDDLAWAVGLRIETTGKDALVDVRPLVGFRKRYRVRIGLFLRSRSPSDDERQWPPLRTWEEQTALPGAKELRKVAKAVDGKVSSD